jgi:hypothetical protein
MIWWRRPARNAGLPVIPNRQAGSSSHNSRLAPTHVVHYDKTFENYSRTVPMKRHILDGQRIELLVPRMCEAHPCTDEPDGTSVAPNFQAFSYIVIAPGYVTY